MRIDICKKDIDHEIDLGSKYSISYDNGKCYNCKKIDQCIDLHLKIMYLIDCENCEEQDNRICKSCLSYMTYIVENNKFNKLVRYNILALMEKYRFNSYKTLS